MKWEGSYGDIGIIPLSIGNGRFDVVDTGHDVAIARVMETRQKDNRQWQR